MDGRLTRGFAADAAPPPGYFMAPHPGLRIRLATLAVLVRQNGLRRGEECALRMVKNLPAADGEEQLALW